jgi:hypothetical protein
MRLDMHFANVWVLRTAGVEYSILLVKTDQSVPQESEMV